MDFASRLNDLMDIDSNSEVIRAAGLRQKMKVVFGRVAVCLAE